MSATFWQALFRVQETVQLAEDQRLALTASGATGFLTQEAVILTDGVPLDTFDSAAYGQAELNSRGLAATFLNSFGGELAACFTEIAKVVNPLGGQTGVPQVDPTQVLPIIYQFMANNQTGSTIFASPPLVNSRNITYGTPTYGASIVGNGTLYRLTVDAYGFNLEGGFAETLNAICTADAQSGTIVGQEQFTVRGQPFRDSLTWFSSGYGSGLNASWVGVTADTTQPLAQNSSFSQSTGAGSTFALTGWTQTSGVAASMSLNTTTYYRAAAIEGTTPASLAVTATVVITQLLSSNAGALALTAYLNRLAINFQSATGSVTVAIGSKSWSVSSGVAGWNLLLPTRDKNLWFQNFNTASLAVTITVTVTGGTGAILVDDFCWSPMQTTGGTLWWLIGGSTAFRVNDTILAVDAEPSPPSKVQNWIRLMLPGYFLPSVVMPTAPVTAAVLAASATAGAVTAGAHWGYVTFVTAVGESGLGPVSNIAVVDGTKKIDWSAIPTGGGSVTKRRLYRTKANAVGIASQPYFVAEIANNIDTTYADNVADAALTLIPGSTGDPVN